MDSTADALRDDLRKVGALLRGYGLIERAGFVERLSHGDDETLLVVASGLELWGGSGAVWETAPSRYTYTDVTSADTDFDDLERAMVRIADRLDEVGLGSLSQRNADLLRRQLGEM